MSSEIVSIVFRLLNFGVVCAVAVYIFKAKSLPNIKEKIAAKHAELQDMTKENQSLLDRQQALEQDVKQQELFGKKLYDQIKIWSVSFEQQLKELEKEREILAQNAGKRMRQQAERKSQDHVEVLVLAKALKSAQQKLQDRFSSEQEGKKFIASIVERMGEDRA